MVLRYSLSLQDNPVYYIRDSVIKASKAHCDLGVILTSDLSWSAHYNKICSSAYRSLYMIRRSFSLSLPTALKKHLYLSLVRSHLTYCSQIWRPNHVKDILIIERVQHRATKYILQDYRSDYKSRLTSLNLLPLMYWFELQDLLFLVKCLKDSNDSACIHDHIQFVSSSTRAGSGRKLAHNFCRTSIVRHFYYNRVVLLWNAMPAINLDLSLRSIKRQLCSFLWDHFLDHFDPDTTCSYHFLCPCSNCYSLPGH